MENISRDYNSTNRSTLYIHLAMQSYLLISSYTLVEMKVARIELVRKPHKLLHEKFWIYTIKTAQHLICR